MEQCLNYLFCRTPLAKEIAKHAALTIIPQAFLGGVLAGLDRTHSSSFDEPYEKYLIMGAIILLLVGHIVYLVHYYIKVFERCRARRQIFFVDAHPMRMWPQQRSAFVDEDNYVEILPNRQVVYIA